MLVILRKSVGDSSRFEENDIFHGNCSDIALQNDQWNTPNATWPLLVI